MNKKTSNQKKIKVTKKNKSSYVKRNKSSRMRVGVAEVYRPILRSAKENIVKIMINGTRLKKKLITTPMMRHKTLKRWQAMTMLLRSKKKNSATRRQNCMITRNKCLKDGRCVYTP